MSVAVTALKCILKEVTVSVITTIAIKGIESLSKKEAPYEIKTKLSIPLKTADPVEEELTRVVSLFVDRFRAENSVLSHKDMLCSLCSDLLDISSKASMPKKEEIEKFAKFVELNLIAGSDPSFIAQEMFTQIIGGGLCKKAA